MLTLERFLASINAYLKKSGMSESAFGRAAVGDPNFVADMRAGRMPGLRLVGKVDAFIRENGRRSPEPARARAS